jgi:hypothetical protein
MNTQVTNMLGRFQKTGMKLFTESTKALSKPMVQYAIGSILILYITFLESESESILSVAMTNPLGRLLVLLVLLLLVSVSVPIGILFAILVVMSCTNRENFESVPPNNFTLPSTPPSGFQDDDAMQRAVEATDKGMEEGMEEEKTFEEAFLSNHSMSPELKEYEMEGFQVPEPVNGKQESESTDDGEIKGFASQTTHSLF